MENPLLSFSFFGLLVEPVAASVGQLAKTKVVHCPMVLTDSCVLLRLNYWKMQGERNMDFLASKRVLEAFFPLFFYWS